MTMQQQAVASGEVYQTVQVGPLDENLPAPLPRRDFTQAFMTEAPIGSPAWWVLRLLAKLDARTDRLLTWDAYYRGDQPLAFASKRFREAFGGRFAAFSSNFCALVVDGTRERMEVTGLTFKSQGASTRAWDIWQQNQMDALSQIAHTEALIKGIVYAMVEPDQLGGTPVITIEDPLTTIVESDPRDRRVRRAGLKRWLDDAGHLVVYLYLPESIWRLRSTDQFTTGAKVAFEPLPGAEFFTINPLGSVPLVPLVNRPRLHGDGQSEIDPVMSNQDAVNKYRADALVAAEFAAFRQRWATGLEIPVDPDTGVAIEPFKAAVDRLWVVPPPDPEDPNPTTTKFGEFEATDLAPYQTMIESEIGAMSSISRMPYHYLLGQPDAVPPSGESLKSSETGLVSKVKTQLIHFGEGWEETARLCLVAVGDAAGQQRDATTEWRDPETRNEATRADATSKAYSTGIIDRNEARGALGYPPSDDPGPPPPPPTTEP